MEVLQDAWETVVGYYDDFVAVLPKLALGIVVFFAFLIIAGWVGRIVNRTLTNRMEDPLLADFLARMFKIALIVVGFVVVLQIIGLSGAAGSILAGAGIGAFVIGFAFKDIGENFLAGIIMAFKRPFNIGDIIETNDITGKVIGLTLRDTQIKTFNGKDVFIPNGHVMKNAIINRTIDGYLRYDFVVGLDYEDDLRRATELIKSSVSDTPGVLSGNGRDVAVRFEEMGTSTINARAFLWVDMDDPRTVGVDVLSEAIQNTVFALADEGFYLPADIIEIKNYNGNKLVTEAKKEAEASTEKVFSAQS